VTEGNIVQKVTRWKPMSKHPTGRPKMRRKDDVLEDIRIMNARNWKNVAQNRGSWKEVVERAALWKKRRSHERKYL
jgi:hypothetical protein